MANENHVEILKQGWSMWYKWHIKHPDEKLDLQGAFLSEVDIGSIDLRCVDLSNAYLNKIQFNYTDLRGANLSGASIQSCNFTSGTLNGADLSGSDLFHTSFHDVDLHQANFEGCFCGYNVFALVDLSMTKGLEKTIHYAASSLSFDSLMLSKGKIADNFLRGCGLSDNLIHTLPSFIKEASQYYSCLLMYYTAEKALVERLYTRLQAAGVRCWLYERGGGHGNKNRQVVNLLASPSYEKTIICCSKNVLETKWLSSEIERTEALEELYGDKRLMSIDMDGCLVGETDGRLSNIVMHRRLAFPFSGWIEDADFEASFAQLLNALHRNDTNPSS